MQYINFVNHRPLRQKIFTNLIQPTGDMLLEAWKLTHERHPDWRLTIVGGGEEKEQRERQIVALGLESSVELLPPTPQIIQEYFDSSIYVLSSRYEGFGMVLLEAMSCGLPTIAFDCKCGPKDIITDKKDGLLVETGNLVKLADAICRLIENPDLCLRMGKEAAETIREKFNPNKIMTQWDQLFKKFKQCKKY